MIFIFSSTELRELFAEYHLGRGAFRLCKRGTKYCGWDRTMPDFYKWRSEIFYKAIKMNLTTVGTCVLFTTASRIFTRCLQTERRLIAEPGLGTASLSLQGYFSYDRSSGCAMCLSEHFQLHLSHFQHTS